MCIREKHLVHNCHSCGTLVWVFSWFSDRAVTLPVCHLFVFSLVCCEHMAVMLFPCVMFSHEGVLFVVCVFINPFVYPLFLHLSPRTLIYPFRDNNMKSIWMCVFMNVREQTCVSRFAYTFVLIDSILTSPVLAGITGTVI